MFLEAIATVSGADGVGLDKLGVSKAGVQSGEGGVERIGSSIIKSLCLRLFFQMKTSRRITARMTDTMMNMAHQGSRGHWPVETVILGSAWPDVAHLRPVGVRRDWPFHPVLREGWS